MTGGLSAPLVRTMVVTPDIAAEWLERNTHNRTPRRASLARYVRDMQADRWQMTGESVKFGRDGVLLDGQTRLMACVAAGVPFTTVVMWDVDPAAQHVMDSGAPRSPGDTLALAGVRNATIVAAAARVAILVESRQSNEYKPTHAEVEAWVTKHPGVEEFAATGRALARRARVAPSVVAYTMLRFSEVDAHDARVFWQDAATRVALGPGDPVAALVERLTTAALRHESLPTTTVVGAVFRVWNARRSGRDMWRVPMRGNGGQPIDIPTTLL